jgi:hypothetical protein
LAAAPAAGASAHGVNTITIRHQMRGCHAWSVTGSAWTPSLRIRADRDALVQVINNDVMPHRLVQLSGPKARLSTPNMNRLGARAQFNLAGKGVYVFRTRAGEDYPNMGDMHTMGADNVLRLTIVVT